MLNLIFEFSIQPVNPKNLTPVEATLKRIALN